MENDANASVTKWSLRNPSKYVQNKDSVQTFKNSTKAQAKINKRIIASELNPKAVSANPVAVILMGSPASGKTTTGRPYAKKILGDQEVTVIDPDSVKAKMNGYDGWNAGAFHEESSLIAEKSVFPMAVTSRHNIIIDITGKNSGKVADMAKLLKSLNYKVGLVHVGVDGKVALGRASSRFAKEGGRYVPFGYIKGSAGQARSTWAKLTGEGIADIGYSLDGNAERKQGQDAPIKETYGNIF